jgi:hypothetical protein
MELPQEYWRQRTLFEIASAIGTPLSLDESTINRTFGHYARVLVDMDLSRLVFDEVMVEREGFAFKIQVVYERLPEFCSHCQIIGHNIHACKWLQPDVTTHLEHNNKQHEKTSKAIKQEYVAKANASYVAEPKKIAPKTITTKHTVTMKHIEQYTDAATVSDGQNTKLIEIVECSDGDFSDEELLIVVQDKDLKLNDSEPATVQQLEMEAHPVQVHVASNAPIMSSTGLEVHYAPNAVAAERQEADGESVVHTLEREDTVLSDTLSPATHVRLGTDSGRPIPDTTQQMMILPDEDFDDVVRADLKLIKQVWAEMATGEKSFTPVVSKSQRKKIKQLARNRGQPYNTRSMGATSHISP